MDNNNDINLFLTVAGKCSNPMELTNALVVGYEDPALHGQNITFTCPPGQMHSGPNSATCMGNGKWEPDPGEIDCTGGVETTSAITLGIII